MGSWGSCVQNFGFLWSKSMEKQLVKVGHFWPHFTAAPYINDIRTERSKSQKLSYHFQPLHYGATVKLEQKWPTLTNCFSMDFAHRVPKFCTQLPQLPDYTNKYKYWKLIFDKWEINPKNLFGVFAQDKIGLKKILSQEEFCFVKGTFCANTPK